jgi:hypothetical protein
MTEESSMAIDPEVIGLAGAWLWDRFGKELVEQLGDRVVQEAKQRWKQVQWEKAAQYYRSRVRELFSTMRLLGKPEPVNVAGIYTDAYVLDKPTAMLRFDIDQLMRQHKATGALALQGTRYSALQLATNKNKLFVLGKPGAGKTTFLKYLVLQACDMKLDYVPIFISLHELSKSGLDLMEFIVRQFEICDFPDASIFINHLLKSGKALVLFDGLDEVTEADEKRRQLTDEIERFTTRYGKNKTLITCRIAATEYLFDKFIYVELADFTDEQIKSFANNWFGRSAKASGFLTELNKLEHRGLKEMAQTPILLALLCLNFDESMSFPSRRVELYEEAIDALLKKWDSSRSIKRDEIYKTLSITRKRQLFAFVAASFYDEGKIYFQHDLLAQRIAQFLSRVPTDDEAGQIDGDVVIKAIEAQHGLFVERARSIYSFSHLTVQEYFTAKYIEDSAERGAVRILLENHSTDPSWREVILLTASKLADADGFVTHFQKRLDKLLSTEPALVKLFKWAEIKAQRDYSSLQSGPLSRARALTIGLFLDDESRRAVDLLNGLLYDIEPSLPLNTTDIGKNLTQPQKLHFAAMEALRKLIEVCAEKGLDELGQALRQMEWRGRQVTVDWHQFDASLRELLIQHRDIGHIWDVGEDGRHILEEYRYATGLLLDCLKLAIVTNRETVESRVYLPTLSV